jgi:hypothetical protein
MPCLKTNLDSDAPMARMAHCTDRSKSLQLESKTGRVSRAEFNLRKKATLQISALSYNCQGVNEQSSAVTVGDSGQSSIAQGPVTQP